MRDLIAELKRRLAQDELKADLAMERKSDPPLGEGGVVEAEKVLRFKLPRSLRRIYAEVANGGFGPSYGLLGLRGGALNEDGEDVVALYETFRGKDPKDEFWNWPEALLPVGHLGCGMYCCVDAKEADGPVIWFEPNPHEPGAPWDDSFVALANSTDEWLLAWLDGEDLLEKRFRD